MASENKYDIATLQALYQADLAKYQTISESNTSLDTKNGLLIGAIIAVGVFIFQDPLFAKATGDCTPFGYFLFSLLIIRYVTFNRCIYFGYIRYMAKKVAISK